MTVRPMTALERSDQDAARVASPEGRRITLDFIRSRIKDVRYTYDGTLTVAVVEHVNGFNVVGTSACADPKNYNRAYGQEKAHDAAVAQLWGLEAFLLREQMMAEAAAQPVAGRIVAVIPGGYDDGVVGDGLDMEKDGFRTVHPAPAPFVG